MTLAYPVLIPVAVLLTAAAVAAYVLLVRARTAALRGRGIALATTTRGASARRHLPYALYLAAFPVLLTGLARPHATLDLPHVGGTVVLVFDVSTSMSAADVQPSRLAVAQSAATSFVQAQPESVDIGVVVFGQTGLTTQQPTNDHGAVSAAISRLKTSGGTSLTQAILAGLSAVVGHPVTLPSPDATEAPDLGYHGSATIVLFSDGQDGAGQRGDSGGGSAAEAAAQLAADAGVRIETVGVGTTKGTTVEVDGYQVATALDEQKLTSIAQITRGTYHQAGDAAALADIARSIDGHLTTKPQKIEVTAVFAVAAILLLTAGALLMIRWYGRIV
jgi:Ca-activated chloride channel family protein